MEVEGWCGWFSLAVLIEFGSVGKQCPTVWTRSPLFSRVAPQVVSVVLFLAKRACTTLPQTLPYSGMLVYVGSEPLDVEELHFTTSP